MRQLSLALFILIAMNTSYGRAHAADVWLSPNLQSADYRALMDFNWNVPVAANVFKFHMANLGNDSSAVGPNTVSEILARNGFARLMSFGMRISLGPIRLSGG